MRARGKAEEKGENMCNTHNVLIFISVRRLDGSGRLVEAERLESF